MKEKRKPDMEDLYWCTWMIILFCARSPIISTIALGVLCRFAYIGVRELREEEKINKVISKEE
jgi:hypothetical protein